MKTERPTPETDAEWDRLQMLPGGGYSSQVDGVKLAFGMARWASQLERQRNQYRDLARELRDALQATASFPLTGDWYTQAADALTKAKEVLG